MVRAILAEQKTQTRRVVKPHRGNEIVNLRDAEGSDRFSGRHNDPDSWGYQFLDDGAPATLSMWPELCPYGQPGDRLWVRETWGYSPSDEVHRRNPENLFHRATYTRPDEWNSDEDPRWRPSIHMPRWACRLELEITGVRVERLQDITEEGATAEGIADGGCLTCGESEPCGCTNANPSRRDSFAHLWMQINGADSWQPNPWVWVIEFKPVKP